MNDRVECIATRNFSSSGNPELIDHPVGTLYNFAKGSIPNGWIPRNGQTILELADYPELQKAMVEAGIVAIGNQWEGIDNKWTREVRGLDEWTKSQWFPHCKHCHQSLALHGGLTGTCPIGSRIFEEYIPRHETVRAKVTEKSTEGVLEMSLKPNMRYNRKLTEQGVNELVSNGASNLLWAMIERERELVRAEVLKDHYAFGERVVVKAKAGDVECQFFPTFKDNGRSNWFVSPGLEIIRIPQSHPMTIKEMLDAVVRDRLKHDLRIMHHEERLGDAWAMTAIDLANGKTALELCNERGISTEVQE